MVDTLVPRIYVRTESSSLFRREIFNWFMLLDKRSIFNCHYDVF